MLKYKGICSKLSRKIGDFARFVQNDKKNKYKRGKPSPRSNRLRRFPLPLLRAQAPPAMPALLLKKFTEFMIIFTLIFACVLQKKNTAFTLFLVFLRIITIMWVDSLVCKSRFHGVRFFWKHSPRCFFVFKYFTELDSQ
ncbi:MAG: hypothetical protein IJ558_04965 [Treponema sp.]|nr:hypothetical protein [Treponema sp.]